MAPFSFLDTSGVRLSMGCSGGMKISLGLCPVVALMSLTSIGSLLGGWWKALVDWSFLQTEQLRYGS